METREILRAIKKLPISERILIIERTLKTIREKETGKMMDSAADALLQDYKNDEELTAFTVLDCDTFYEAR